MNTMSDDTIRDLLRKLNSGKGKNIVYRNSIGGNVEIAKVWIWKGREYLYKNQDFFLIRNEGGKYVAAIYGKNKFHWYSLFEERRKGYLSNALRNYVIPFLWGINRHPIEEPFEISINRGVGPRNFDSSLALAKSIGFKVDETANYKTNLSLSYDDFTDEDLAAPDLTPNISSESRKRLLEKGEEFSDLFLQITGELEVRLGENFFEELEELKDFKYRLQRIFENHDLANCPERYKS